MDNEVTFSLSYEQLTRMAEERIRECELDSQAANTSANRVRPPPFWDSGMNLPLMVRH